MLGRITFSFLMFIVLMTQYSCMQKEDKVRERININRDWKFLLGDHPGAEVLDYNDEGWEYVNIPHSFSTPYFQTGFWYSGYGWYRKNFEVSENWLGKKLFIEFEGAFRDAEIFVNGVLAGTHQSGYTGFSVDITDFVKAGKNILAVRLNNLWNSQLAPRGGDHIFPGGIYRDVSLLVTNPAHVTWYGTFVTTPQVSKGLAIVNVKTEVKNDFDIGKTYELNTIIFDRENKEVDSFSSSLKIEAGQTATFDQTGHSINNAQFWHPKHPYLYKAVSELYDDQDLVDRYETTFGIRWMEWSADKGFFLNGEHYYFKGANVHQDHAGWANAVTNAGFLRDVRMIKDAGMDFIRGSHYPHDPSFSDACDSLGILFLQENNLWSCGIRGDGGWYTGDGLYPLREEDKTPFEESVKTSLKEMIRIQRNHPSIIAWSMCNEPFFTQKSTLPVVKKFLEELVGLSHQLDPSRKVVVGGVQRGDLDKTGDIAGYNGDGARLFINPGTPNIVTEYGSTIEDRPGTYTPGWGDLQQKQYSWRSGQCLWCAFDYGTHIGSGKFGHMGMIDYYRLPKKRWYWYRNKYRKIPPPEWPHKGVPAKLQLLADKTVISKTDGTDDVHLIVAVLDKEGKPINNCPDVTLIVESGPGRFPTGKQITFSADSDIVIRDGKAAIEFRSYYGGKTIIKARSKDLEDANISITTKGKPEYIENKSIEPKDLFYMAYRLPELSIEKEKGLNLAYFKPTKVSSELISHYSRMVNDNDVKTFWASDSEEGESWCQVDLEAILTINKVDLYFPQTGNYSYLISVSEDGKIWKILSNQRNNKLAYEVKKISLEEGIEGRFLKVTFFKSSSGQKSELSEIAVFSE